MTLWNWLNKESWTPLEVVSALVIAFLVEWAFDVWEVFG